MPPDELTPEPYLIRGRPRKRPLPSWHPDVQRTALAVARSLDGWLAGMCEPTVEVWSHPEVQLRLNPPTIIRLPLAVMGDRLPTLESDRVPGIPLVAVEVMIGADTFGALWERVTEYQECGVAVVWVVNPDFGTVTVHRPGVPPAALDASGAISGDPELPGFSCPVADFFR